MNFIDVVKSFESLGCEDLKQCSIAARVYNDLKDVQGLDNIEKCYDQSLDVLYFRCEEAEFTKVYFPHSSHDDIILRRLTEIQKKICPNHYDSLIMSICDPGSNIMHFKLTDPQRFL